METEAIYTHDEFDPELDFELAQEWVKARGKYTIRPEWLPACGFVVSRNGSPVVMFFIYFDPSCRVGFVEWFITRPGQLITVTMEAWRYALSSPVRYAMSQHGATIILTRSPAGMARQLLKTPGWQCDDVPLFSTSYQIEEDAYETL